MAIIYINANQKLPEDAVILTSHDHFVFRKPLKLYFRLYLNAEKEFNYYKDYLIKPTHILYNGQDHNIDSDIFKNCRGKLMAEGKNIPSLNPRNPFHKNKEKYDVYIYEVDLNKLINCKIN